MANWGTKVSYDFYFYPLKIKNNRPTKKLQIKIKFEGMGWASRFSSSKNLKFKI